MEYNVLSWKKGKRKQKVNARKAGKDKGISKVTDISPESFEDTQLSLFQHFTSGDDERDKLSNTVELWDGVPKYFISRDKMNSLRKDGILPTLERTFRYGDRALKVKIRPARLTDKDGKDKEFYPSATEELVEDALRKIAADHHRGFLQEQESGVVFSLHMLRQELKRRGHSRSYQQVIEALQVMSGASIELSSADGKAFLKTSVLTTLAGASLEDWRKDPQARWYAVFSPLVTQSIRALTYRQFNYHQMMAHHSRLARWFHKRLAHNYSQASLIAPYEIKFSTIQRDSGLLDYKELRRAVHKLESCLHELIENHVLMSFTRTEERGGRRSIIDVKYSLVPAVEFIRQVKAANKRQSALPPKII